MTFNLFGPRPRNDMGRILAIRQWTKEVFRLPECTAVMVAELHCAEPCCPPLETIIAILDEPGPPRQYKIHKPLADVTVADVRRLAEAPAGPCSVPHSQPENRA